MVLSDKQIVKYILSKDLVITPILNGKEQIGSSSFDIRLGSIFKYLKVVKQTHFDLDQSIEDLKDQIEGYSEEINLRPLEPFILHSKDFVLASTLEYIKIPPFLTARLEGRSTWGRVGLQVHSTAGLVDPGFKGSLTFELHNLGKLPLPLFPGIRIGQLVFYDIHETSILYHEKEGSKLHEFTGPRNSTFYDEYDYKILIEKSKKAKYGIQERNN